MLGVLSKYDIATYFYNSSFHLHRAFSCAMALDGLTNLLTSRDHCLVYLGSRTTIIKFEKAAEILNILFEVAQINSSSNL
jgi:hypothetical protein